MSYPPPPPNPPDDSGSTPPPAPPPPPPYGSAPGYGAPQTPGYQTPDYQAPGYPPPGYPPPGYAAPGGYAVPSSNQKALWSLILGILSLFCCGVLTGVAAIVLAQQAKKEIAASGGMQSGSGQAQAGFILGIIGIALTVIGLIAYAGLAASGNY